MQRGAIVTVWTILLLLLPAGCSAASSGDRDDPAAGWVSLAGKLTTDRDANATVLNWRFDYGKEPSTITCAAGAPWKAMKRLSFEVKSDRDGPLFIRFDQTDKKIFLTHFNVSRNWQTVHLLPTDLKPFGAGATGLLDSAKLDRVFIVDLAGKDGGARGKRSVAIRSMSTSRNTKRAQARGPGGVSLVAFDADGRILNVRRMVERGTSAGAWCFLTDEAGEAVAMTVDERSVDVDGRSASVPVLQFDTKKPAALEVMFWPVGTEFKVWLQADGRGAGIQRASQDGVVLLNLELAYTRLRKLRDYDNLEPASPFAGQIRALADELTAAEKLPSLKQQAAAADGALERLLRLSRETVRRRSLSLIEAGTAAGPPVKIPTPKPGLLKPGVSATVQLIEPDFHIGVGQSFGFVLKRTPASDVESYYSELRRAGFNFYVLPLFWDQLVGDDGRYKPQQWDRSLGFSKLVELGYRLSAHSIVQSSLPKRVKNLKGSAFTQAAKKQLETVAADYGRRMESSICLWEAINEPSSNAYGDLMLDDRAKMVSALVGELRSRVPGAKVLVNDFDWERGLEANKPPSTRTVLSTPRFFARLLATQHKPDVLGLEWYPGLRVDRPMFKLDVAEPCRDLLDTSLYWDRLTDLGLPLIISECNFPGGTKRGDKNGYAWGPWNEQSQAAAAVDTLHLAMSKPRIIGWVWWSITDDEPWNRDGGLYAAPRRQKPVVSRLEAAISEIKRSRRETVDSSGEFPLATLPGTYRITLDDGYSWHVHRDKSGQISLNSGG